MRSPPVADVPTDIDLDQLDRKLAAGATLVEVLPAGEYDEEHLPGAVNLPLKILDAVTTAVLPADRALVVYCWDSL